MRKKLVTFEVSAYHKRKRLGGDGMCTSVSITAKNGYQVLGRTMDWDDLYVLPIYVPAGFQWHSKFDGRQYQNKYALVGGGFQDQDYVDISDGVNECGLMAQKLTFTNGANLVDEKDARKVQLEAFEFVHYVLGNFASIAEIEAHLSQIELMSNANSNHKNGGAELHFSLTDLTGRTVVIEPSTNPLKVIDNPMGIVTNMPNFERQLAKLEDYMEFSDDFKMGHIKPGTFHVTTGKLGGKKSPLGGFSPSQRFVRAAYVKELADQPTNESQALSLTFGVLDTVTVPKSMAHRPTYTVYRAATSAQDLTYYYQAADQAQVSSLRLTPELMQTKEVRVFASANIWQAKELN